MIEYGWFDIWLINCENFWSHSTDPSPFWTPDCIFFIHYSFLLKLTFLRVARNRWKPLCKPHYHYHLPEKKKNVCWHVKRAATVDSLTIDIVLDVVYELSTFNIAATELKSASSIQMNQSFLMSDFPN